MSSFLLVREHPNPLCLDRFHVLPHHVDNLKKKLFSMQSIASQICPTDILSCQPLCDCIPDASIVASHCDFAESLDGVDAISGNLIGAPLATRFCFHSGQRVKKHFGNGMVPFLTAVSCMIEQWAICQTWKSMNVFKWNEPRTKLRNKQKSSRPDFTLSSPNKMVCKLNNNVIIMEKK